MSEENVEIVRTTYAEMARGNFSTQGFDPEIDFESFMPDASERVVAHGPGEVEAFMREFLAQWRDYRIVGEEFREVRPDRVFVAGYQTATGVLSGAVVKGPIFSVWTLRDGRVVELVFETDRRAALEAAGLSE